MYLLVGIISFIAGGAFGVFLMCAFQINRMGANARFEVEPPEIGGQ